LTNSHQTVVQFAFDVAAVIAFLFALWLVARWAGVAHKPLNLATVSRWAVLPVIKGGWIGAAFFLAGLVGHFLIEPTLVQVAPWFLCIALGAPFVAAQLALRFYLPDSPKAPFKARLVWESRHAVSLHLSTTKFAFSGDASGPVFKFRSQFKAAIHFLSEDKGLIETNISTLMVGSPWFLLEKFNNHAERELKSSFQGWSVAMTTETMEPIALFILKFVMYWNLAERKWFKRFFEQSDLQLGQLVATALALAPALKRRNIDPAKPYPMWIVAKSRARA
jgi:hypothetical protein